MKKDYKPRRDYLAQSYAARNRGIVFKMSFEEWLGVWKDSGKFHLRGRGKGLYCMARLGDKGPYAVGNVKICTLEENRAEQDQKGRVFSAHHCAALSAAAKNRAVNNRTGTKHSPETIAKMSAARKAQGSFRNGMRRNKITGQFEFPNGMTLKQTRGIEDGFDYVQQFVQGSY